MGEVALVMAVDIQAARERAQWYYDEGIRGSGWLRSQLAQLDRQEEVRNAIDISLAFAEKVFYDAPLLRDDDRRVAPRRRNLPRVGKFARSL